MSEGKRKLPPKVAAMHARKKQKLDASNRISKRPKAPPKKRKVDIKSVPGRKLEVQGLDDYEGILDFEEISDVEVEKGESGTTFYFSGSAAAEAESQGDAMDVDDDGSSWEGFSDDEKETQARPVQESTKPAKPKKEKKSDSKSKAVANGNAEPKTATPNGLFAALNEDNDEDDTDVSAWRSLKLSPDTMAALGKLKFTKPTPIQKAVIPETFQGHDVVGKASTGSGKTLAFGIPILESFLEKTAGQASKRTESAPIALILSPTRELAHQLNHHLSSLFEGVYSYKPSIATVTGGLSLHKQQRLLKDADVVIGTPGRLWEIISSGSGVLAALKQIEFLVVDEADRLLSEGHFKEVEEILTALDRVDTNDEDDDEEQASKAATPAKRQTLVFSATFDRGLQKKLTGKTTRKDNLLGNKETMEYLLSKLNFQEEAPKFIDVNPVNQLATGLKEGLVECGGTEKDLYLYALLLLNQSKRTMVFTNSVSAVRRITPFLQNLNLNALALHSGMIQKARLRSVERFSQTTTTSKKPSSSSVVLVATDVAARGLDIPNVDLVVHYHLPRTADVYVHRSGRTARAGQQGSSVLICGPEEVQGVRRLVAKVHAQSAVSREENASDAAKQGYYIRTLDIDRKVVSRLKERATLAKKLADATVVKGQHKEEDTMRSWAEELGQEYDSEEFEKQATGKRGRGSGRKKKERQVRDLTKQELGAIKAELKQLLHQRVNVGVSEKYLTAGRVDIDELLRQQDIGAGKTGDFLGTVGNLGLEDL